LFYLIPSLIFILGITIYSIFGFQIINKYREPEEFDLISNVGKEALLVVEEPDKYYICFDHKLRFQTLIEQDSSSTMVYNIYIKINISIYNQETPEKPLKINDDLTVMEFIDGYITTLSVDFEEPGTYIINTIYSMNYDNETIEMRLINVDLLASVKDGLVLSYIYIITILISGLSLTAIYTKRKKNIKRNNLKNKLLETNHS